ncbi:CRISPR-associated endonuclease Cas1 [Polaromonas sp.]|uniref:CRISPR-associated endonuclease Cas1 n=1 Tax=Polaromonas sp. TaxID=1869339 RepID=UPI001A344740|nr:CRISPR-associated endonuclease Cas1 [Comamonadaceae bacterium]
MSLLLLDRAQLEIRSESETLALYENGARRGTVPLKLIERCVIHGAQTRLDTGVLMKLAEAGVTTVLMSPRQTRRIAIVLGPQHNDAAVRLAQAARVMDDAWCRQWALGTVRAKLLRQQRALRTWLAQRPDARKPLFDALQAIEASLRELPARPGAASDSLQALPDLASLRGREGAAARAYFAGLAGVMPPALQFTGRNRRPPRDPVNACLSLGYTLLHAQAVQACATAGLDPLLGFYHRPAFGRESLASDLIESLRPAVDLWVWEQLRTRSLREDHFTLDKGACLLGKAGRAIFYASWESHATPWRRWLRGKTRQLAAALRTDGLPWLAHPDEEDEPC